MHRVVRPRSPWKASHTIRGAAAAAAATTRHLPTPNTPNMHIGEVLAGMLQLDLPAVTRRLAGGGPMWGEVEVGVGGAVTNSEPRVHEHPHARAGGAKMRSGHPLLP